MNYRQTMKREVFLQWVQFALDLGYRVFTPADLQSTYFYAADNQDRLAYFQVSDFGKPEFSTVHKPCKYNGTGFGVTSLANAFTARPSWTVHNPEPKKYSGVAELLATRHCEFVEITSIDQLQEGK